MEADAGQQLPPNGMRGGREVKGGESDSPQMRVKERFPSPCSSGLKHVDSSGRKEGTTAIRRCVTHCSLFHFINRHREFISGCVLCDSVLSPDDGGGCFSCLASWLPGASLAGICRLFRF